MRINLICVVGGVGKNACSPNHLVFVVSLSLFQEKRIIIIGAISVKTTVDRFQTLHPEGSDIGLT